MMIGVAAPLFTMHCYSGYLHIELFYLYIFFTPGALPDTTSLAFVYLPGVKPGIFHLLGKSVNQCSKHKQKKNTFAIV